MFLLSKFLSLGSFEATEGRRDLRKASRILWARVTQSLVPGCACHDSDEPISTTIFEREELYDSASDMFR